MSEQFDSSRPIYAQLVERLKARILAGTYQPGGHLDAVRDLWPQLPGSTPTRCRGLWPSWKVRALCAPSAPADATSRRIRI